MTPRALLPLLAALLFSANAYPQPGRAPAVVRVSAKPSAPSIAPGGQLAVAVVLDHAPGWHTHTHEPVIPPELGDFVAIPTTIEVLSLTGARAGPVQWPAPEPVPVRFGPSGQTALYEVFGGRAIAFLPLIVEGDAVGEVSLTLGVGYQPCDDSTCLPPVFPDDPDAQISLRIPIDPAAPSPAPDPDFANFDAAVFATMHDAPPPRAAGPAPNPAPITTPAPRPFLGFIPIPPADSPLGLAVIALLAAVGGLVLNLTPCVLPIIPIKIMTISQHAGSPGRALSLGLAMAAGVVAFWLGLGLLAVVVLGVADPSVVFGIWYVTLTIGLLIGVMALGLLGLFTFNLPQGVYLLNPRADNAWGSFLFGVMTAVLGLPCFGFVAGALLAGSLSLPKPVVLTIFASLGVGMAAPYLVLSARPGLLAKIPRTGPASELVKQVMGLLLMAAAAFFTGTGLIALVSDRPYITGVLHWWAVCIFGALAGLWLAWRTLRIAGRPLPRIVFTIVGLALASLSLFIAWGFDRAEYRRWDAARAANPDAGAHSPSGPWMRYTPERLREARDSGRIIVIDFTAEWCLTCKTLESTVLSTAAVRDALAARDVISLKADLTSRNDPGWTLLNDLGQVGIPLLVVFPPSADSPSFTSNAYTPDMVVQAINRAREPAPPRTAGGR